MHVKTRGPLAMTLIAVVALVFGVGCGSDYSSSPAAPTNQNTGGGGGGGGGSTAAFTAVIDGQAWAPTTSTFAVSYANGVLAMTGTDATGWTFAVAIPTSGPGSVPLSTGANAILTSPSSQSWSATHLDGGTGTITVTSLTSNSATGTFSFVLVPVGGGATGNKTIAQGTFSVTF
jgi:hypothetical protein